MTVTRGRLWPFLYGVLFVVVVPVGLLLWARAASAAVPLPVVRSRLAGVVLALAGALLVASGWHALIVHGRGLPMNAFPPPRLVRSGVYRWVSHPIYIGFGLMCAGISIAAGSPGGLWLVTPTAILGAAALVFGYERPSLVLRFGPGALQPPLLSIPGDDPARPTIHQRLAVVVWVLVPWLLAWCAAQTVGRMPDAFETVLPFERQWPVWQWTEVLYLSAYLFVPMTVFLAASQRALRRFAIGGAVATVIVTICWFTIPAVAAHRSFVPASAAGELLAFEQRSSTGVACFPAFHVLWAMLAAVVWSDDARRRGRGPLGWIWAGLIAVSCLTTGMHSLIDVLAAALLFAVVRDPERLWTWIRSRAEAVANSWREWRIGRLRVINHAAYAGLAGAVGFAIAAMAVPADRFGSVVWIALCTLLGAGIWAQILEGSSTLLRPFGWYGGVLGAAVGVVTTAGSAAKAIPLLAALTVAAPWVQALGRLRCLVQGCCHGGPAPPWLGIRYLHRRSRVWHIAGLGGQPIHATPLYSIVGNVLIGVIVLRLRILGASDTMVIGVYLILAGVARFVEEGYRAEPQTPTIAGLHSYQWLAVASVLLGIWFTAVPSVTASTGFVPLSVPIAVGAALVGAIAGAAMGIDLPESSRRFSRLAPTD